MFVGRLSEILFPLGWLRLTAASRLKAPFRREIIHGETGNVNCTRRIFVWPDVIESEDYATFRDCRNTVSQTVDKHSLRFCHEFSSDSIVRVAIIKGIPGA